MRQYHGRKIKEEKRGRLSLGRPVMADRQQCTRATTPGPARQASSTYLPAVPQHAAGATLRLDSIYSSAHHVVFSPTNNDPITARSQLPPMNTDILSLRAELKAFEREFKATHHRPPSVDDIRNAGFGTTRLHQNLTPKRILGSSLPPSTADKYRLYKKLSKLGNDAQSKLKRLQPPIPSPPRRINKTRLRPFPSVVLMDLPILSPLPKRRDSRLFSHPNPYLPILSLPFRRSMIRRVPLGHPCQITPSLGPANVYVVIPSRLHP